MDRQMAMKTILITISIIACSFTGMHADGQTLPPVEINTQTPYYININSTKKSDVYDIRGGILHIQYNDRYGKEKDITLSIRNWKLETVGSFILDKGLGLNQYTIDLRSRIADFETGVSYLCTMSDEASNKYEWAFRDTPTPVNKDFTVDIVVNPIQVSCSGLESNNVEFYGSIQKGKALYAIRWYVLNDNRTDFLYQPREENIEADGKTSVLLVDKTPAYYVVLDVTDACGMNARKVVLMQCRENKKKVNTIFVDPSVIYNNTPLKPIN